MVIKKIPPRAALILSFEEHHRVVKVVALLAAVARRVDNSKRKSVSKEKVQGKNRKKRIRFARSADLIF
jgi:hypothetical protein